MNWRKFLLSLTLVFALSIVLVACGGGDDSDVSDTNGDASGDPAEEQLAADQSLNINIKSEPPSLHPGTSSDTTSSAVLDQVFEGLTRINLEGEPEEDRKSTRLNSSHVAISYAVFCLKKKKIINKKQTINLTS